MTTVRGDVATMSDSVLQDYHTVSHSSGIAPPEELAPLVAAIKSGGGATNWAAVRYASPTSLAMLGSGDGGVVGIYVGEDDGATVGEKLTDGAALSQSSASTSQSSTHSHRMA